MVQLRATVASLFSGVADLYEERAAGSKPAPELRRVLSDLSRGGSEHVLSRVDRRAIVLQRMIIGLTARSEQLTGEFVLAQEAAHWRRRQMEVHTAHMDRLERRVAAVEAELQLGRDEAHALRTAAREARRPASLRQRPPTPLHGPRDSTDGAATFHGTPLSPRTARDLPSRGSLGGVAILDESSAAALPTPGTPRSPPLGGWHRRTESDPSLARSGPSRGSPEPAGRDADSEPDATAVSTAPDASPPHTPPTPPRVNRIASPDPPSFHTAGTQIRGGIRAMDAALIELAACGGDAGGLRCRELVATLELSVIKLQTLFGSSFALATRNDNGNLKKVKAVLDKLSPSCTVREVLAFELSRGVHTAAPPPKGAMLSGSSAAMGLTWLLRSLHFCSILSPRIVHLHATGGPVSEAVSFAYKQSLQPYHGWLLQGIFAKTGKAMLTFDDLCVKMPHPAVPQAERQRAVIEDLEAFGDKGVRLFAALHAALSAMQLIDLRKV